MDRRKFVKDTLGASLTFGALVSGGKALAGAGKIFSPYTVDESQFDYVDQFKNVNNPEIAYWFISPDLVKSGKYVEEVDRIADKSLFTLLFLTAREGANFYDIQKFHPVFSKIVDEAHKKGLKIGLQIWGDYSNVTPRNSMRMIVEDEVTLDDAGRASLTATSRFIRFPSRLMKTELFRVYAFRKTGEGFYDPSTLKDITDRCKSVTPNKSTVKIQINGGEDVKGLTALVMIQEYATQSSQWGQDEINRFVQAMDGYSDIPFDGYALDEYGNKFVERIKTKDPATAFRGRWYSTSMAYEYHFETGGDLVDTLFNGRYAPEGKPEVRIRAINEYMNFMRKGALRIETAIYHKSREIWGDDIFNGIHSTYHNRLTNDEIWADGIDWWTEPRMYGQTDENTPTPTQLGIAMAHPKNAMYNQYYDHVLEPYVIKSLHDLRYGIRTHYHALDDHRPHRCNLDNPDAFEAINRVERCARLLNRFNPTLPDVRLLVVFGMEALSNWYPDYKARGIYDINDTLHIQEKGVEIWEAGYMNAVVPSDMIVNHKLKVREDGKAVMNGHVFDAVLYLYPQYAREPVFKFLEELVARGGKLMMEGTATMDLQANDVTARFNAILDKTTVKGYSISQLPKLGLKMNLLPDGCRNEDGSYVFTQLRSLTSLYSYTFSVDIDREVYDGTFRGLAIISADKKVGVRKFAAHEFTQLRRNRKVILNFDTPVDVFMERVDGKPVMTIADKTRSIKPTVFRL